MSAMTLTFGLGIVPSQRERELPESQRGAISAPPQNVQTAQEAQVKRKLEDLTVNELLYQALYGDLKQFCREAD